MIQEIDLRRVAREIFSKALLKVDAGDAVRRAVRLEGSRLTVCDSTIDLQLHPAGIYALSIGKAAFPMSIALDQILRGKLTAGLVVGPPNIKSNDESFTPLRPSATIWQSLEGGHPLPNLASLTAAKSAFDLLRRANEEHALVIFMISGGGSAMVEWPSDENITLGDLRAANRVLTTCGANIEEINAVRRAYSAIKGGGLAACAPQADQITLVISDTAKGREATVASGPTYDPPLDAPDTLDVITRYKLAEYLPATLLRAVRNAKVQASWDTHKRIRDHCVLLDSESATQAAAEEACRRGFVTEIANEISDQAIDDGCRLMISRLLQLRSSTTDTSQIVCLVSGGEFSCPVIGNGVGGRNAETALRCAIELDKSVERAPANMFRVGALSAGTDGIDGNSPAAGAVASQETAERARMIGLNPLESLERSDAYNFFDALGDTIMTGPTGTNVRDLRILVAG